MPSLIASLTKRATSPDSQVTRTCISALLRASYMAERTDLVLPFYHLLLT